MRGEIKNMATFTHEDNPTKSSLIVRKQRKSTMEKLDNTTVSIRRKSGNSRKSSGGLRRVEPNDRTQSLKYDVSVGDSSAFSPRSLPPLLKNNYAHEKSLADTSSYLKFVGSKRTLPPIKRSQQTYSSEKHDNNYINFHHETVTSRDQLMSKTIPFAEDEDEMLLEEKFIPLRVSTPTNSKTILRRSTNRRTLPKPNHVTFQQHSGEDQQENNLSSLYTKSKSGRTFRYDSSFRSDTDYGGDTDLKERRKLSRTKTRQWVRSSDFTMKTLDNVPSSSETASFPTVSSFPFDDSRYREHHTKSKSMEQLRRIVSNVQPPDLPCKILVHERVSKFHIDLQFRLQHIRDWWSELRFPRLPKITIDIDFARSREAVRRFCTRLRNSLRFPPPLILDPPKRFIIIPPSAWNLYQVPMTADESSRSKVQSLQQYNRKIGYYLQGDVAMVADSDAFSSQSQYIGASVNRRRDSGPRAHVTLQQEKEDGALNDFKMKRHSSLSRSTKSNQRSPAKLQTSMTRNAGESKIKFSSARERLAHILKKLDDPSWYGAWIAKHDEMERDLKRLSKKKLDLIRALTFTVENESCKRSTILGHLQDDEDEEEKRQKMRVHQQYAHHRFRTSTRQPNTTLSPVIHADATAQGSKDMVYLSKFTQPLYTDERPGCIACRVMKAARRYGCEDRLSQVSARPTIENYYSTTHDALVGDAKRN